MNTSYPTLNFGLGEDIEMLRDQVYQFAQNENVISNFPWMIEPIVEASLISQNYYHLENFDQNLFNS